MRGVCFYYKLTSTNKDDQKLWDKKVCQKESALISNAILLIETFEGFCTGQKEVGTAAVV